MNDAKIDNIFKIEVQLILEDELEDYSKASKNLNPLLTYVRFVLTDDKPNANGVRIPHEEFSNLISTGLFMPLKMALGEISEGHDGTVPLGVITHLREDRDTIRGIAALWNRERPDDVAYIKERYAEKKPLDLSWEIGFEDYEEDEAGIKNLRGCVLRATTLVGMPAYGSGRTSIIDVDSSIDETKEDNNVDEKELDRLQEENTSLKARIEDLEAKQITEEQAQQLADYPSLLEFKNTVEAEAARQGKLAEIKTQFSEAGITKDDTYFEENAETLLSLKDSNLLDFFISNLSNSVEENEEESSEDAAARKGVPNIVKTGDGADDESSPRDLGKALRAARNQDN